MTINPDGSGDGTMDMNDLGQGMVTGSGTVTEANSSFTLTGGAGPLVTASGTVNASGEISGSGTVGVPLNFGDFTFSGTISGNDLAVSFNFPGVTGDISLTKA